MVGNMNTAFLIVSIGTVAGTQKERHLGRHLPTNLNEQKKKHKGRLRPAYK